MTAASFCTSCGRPFPSPDARFCGDCGAPRGLVEAPASAATVAAAIPAEGWSAAPPRPPIVDWQARLPAPFASIPPALLAVCILMAAAGAIVLWPVVVSLPDSIKLLGAGSLGRSLGLLLLMVWMVLGFFGVACLLLAWRMAHADRVARGLAYVLLGGLGGSILIGNEHPATLILVMLASFAAIAVLHAGPGVREFFVAEGAPQAGEPTPIVVARTLVAVWAALITLVGLVFLPLGGLAGKFVVVGILFLAIAAGAFLFGARLATGDAKARIIVTVGCAIYPVLLLVLGQRDPGLILPVALVAGIAWNLWVPEDAKRHFDRPAGRG